MWGRRSGYNAAAISAHGATWTIRALVVKHVPCRAALAENVAERCQVLAKALEKERAFHSATIRLQKLRTLGQTEFTVELAYASCLTRLVAEGVT